MSERIESVSRLSKDLAAAARTLSVGEARFLVDAYYAMQANRIRADAQARARMIAISGGQRTVPQLIEEGKIVQNTDTR